MRRHHKHLTLTWADDMTNTTVRGNEDATNVMSLGKATKMMLADGAETTNVMLTGSAANVMLADSSTNVVFTCNA